MSPSLPIARAAPAYNPAMIGESHLRLGADRFVTGTGPLRGRRPRARHAPCGRAALAPRPCQAGLGSTPSARASCPASTPSSPPPTCPAAAIIPNRVPAPGRHRALPAAGHRPRTSCATWASRWRWSWPTTRYVAEDALELIDVVYEPLPVCASVGRRAGARRAAALSPDGSNNVADHHHARRRRRRGAGRGRRWSSASASPIRARPRPRWRRAGSWPCPPDPRGGELHLIGSTKCIHINRTILAPIFGLPPGALRLTEVDVGGGFGVRGELYPEDILVPLAAMKARPARPVDRGAAARTSWPPTTRARSTTRWRSASTADGRIRRACARVIRADIGAYVRTAALVPAEFGAALLPGPYRVPNYACDLWSVVTNKTPAGTLRSPGRPECNFARERLLDQAAGAARPRPGRDPTPQPDPRRARCRTTAAPSRSASPPSTTPAISPRSSTSCSRRLDYDARARRAGGARTRARRARGGASGSRSTSRRPGSAPSRPRTSRRGPTAASSSTPARPRWGRGSRRCWPRSSARRWDCPPTASTSATPTPPPSRAAWAPTARAERSRRATPPSMAADKLIAEARARAAARWGVPEAEVTYARGVAAARTGAASRWPSWRPSDAGRRRLVQVPKITYAGCAVRGRRSTSTRRPAWSRLQRVVVGADVGRAVNPALVEGQLVGGVAFGIGNTLHECLEYDADGQLLSGTLMDYALPLCHRHPADRGLLPGSAAPRPIRSACAAWASAAIPAWAGPSPMRCATRWRLNPSR